MSNRKEYPDVGGAARSKLRISAQPSRLLALCSRSEFCILGPSAEFGAPPQTKTEAELVFIRSRLDELLGKTVGGGGGEADSIGEKRHAELALSGVVGKQVVLRIL